jgi:hypothetical protein
MDQQEIPVLDTKHIVRLEENSFLKNEMESRRTEIMKANFTVK